MLKRRYLESLRRALRALPADLSASDLRLVASAARAVGQTRIAALLEQPFRPEPPACGFVTTTTPEALVKAEQQISQLFILPGGTINHARYPELGRVLQELIDSGEVPASTLEPSRAAVGGAT